MTTKEKIWSVATSLFEQKRLGPEAKVIAHRYKTFVDKIGNDWQCPRCWMDHARQTNLRELHSKTDEDTYTHICGTCYLNV